MRRNETTAIQALTLVCLLVFWLFTSTGCGADHIGEEIGIDPAPTQDPAATTTTTDDTTTTT